MDTVEVVAEQGLCISCGICKEVCPKNCIGYEMNGGGLREPVVNRQRCVDCGRCVSVCPGYSVDYTRLLSRNKDKDSDFWFGPYLAVYTAGTLDVQRRKKGVSGGIVTELVYRLLQSGEYTSAFLVEGHDYREKGAYTRRFTKDDSLEATQKSRYLPVSQSQAASYILAHPEERIILVGTSCFVHGMSKLMDVCHLDRSRYFIIGLFCDRTMTENVISYFGRHPALSGKTMAQLYFRTKEAGGWPGGVQMVTDNGEKVKLNSAERMKVKDYFQPERCLYCLDKLNMLADISVGDNYTGEHADRRGSSSVIIRTAAGKKVWNQCRDAFEYYEAAADKLAASQHLEQRKNNQVYSALKEKELPHPVNITGDWVSAPSVTGKLQRWYRERLRKIRVGAAYRETPRLLSRSLLWKNIKLTLKKAMKRS